MDIAYTFTDSASKTIMYQQLPMNAFKDSNVKLVATDPNLTNLSVWKLKWANGGGPVLMRSGELIFQITRKENLQARPSMTIIREQLWAMIWREN